ncbi:MAG: two-component regulator propeller domain-containing protein [Tahibacter sp.]
MRGSSLPVRSRQPSGLRMAVAVAVAMVGLTAALCSGAHAAAYPAPPPTPRGHFVFRNYATVDGLVYSSVLQLLQDRRGFVWAGTDDALYRFDGYRFDSFGIEQGLPSTAIEALHEDRNGVLWVGTHAGLSRWNGVRFEAVPGASTVGGEIRAIADNAEGLWMATSGGLQLAGDDVLFHPAPGWSVGEATALFQARKTVGLWAAQWNGSARILRREGLAWREYSFAEGPPHERIDALAEDGRGHIWARSAKGLWKLDPAQADFQQVVTPVALEAARGFLSTGRRGDVWVPTNDAVLHREGDIWTDILEGGVLGSRPILEDREGSVWFGARGLRRMAGRGVLHAYDKSEGLPGNVAWSIARDQAQTLWVGTDRGLARAVGERFETIDGTATMVVRTIVVRPDGVLYIAGIPTQEVMTYDPAKQRLEHHPIGLEPSPGRIFRLALDRHGILWAGTDNAGLLRADTRDPELRFTREALPAGTPQEYIRDLREDAAGRLWAAGELGLAVREDGQWRRLRRKDGLRHDAISYVYPTRNGDLLVAYAGVNGWARMRYEKNALRIVQHRDYANTRSANEIFIIAEDASENVWIGTGRGVELITPARSEHFTATDGLLGEDTASMAVLAEPDGDLWFGVVGGLMRFDAAAYRALPPRSEPIASLVDVRVGDQSMPADAREVRVPYTANAFQVRFAGLSFIGDDAVQYRTRLDGLETTENVTESHEARYSALPNGRYQFEVSARMGHQGTWGPPAVFAFQVLPAWWQTWWARALFAISVILAGLLALRWRFAALRQHTRMLEEYVDSRTAALSQANAQLHSEIDDRLAAENAVQQRNAELESLNRKLAGTQSQLLQSEKMASVGQLAAGVAHEINNPIGFVHSNLCSLKRYVEEIFSVLGAYEGIEPALPRAHPELARLQEIKERVDLDYLRRDTDDLLAETMDGITRVKKIVQDLKDFSHLDKAEWERVDVHQALDSTLNVVAHELKYKADVVKNYGDLPPIECLPFQIKQVFMNLLVNATQAIEGRGTVSIQTGCDTDSVWIAISDTGKGIEPANLHRIFEPFFTTKPVGVGTGLGLSVSYGIVQKHGGSIEVISQPGLGSTFTLRLPINGQHALERAQ